MLVEAAIRALRDMAKLHPMLEEGERRLGPEFLIAQACALGCILADALEVPFHPDQANSTEDKKYNRVPIEYAEIVRVYRMAIDEFEKTKMRPVAMLVFAAMIVQTYAAMGGKPIDDIVRTVRTYAHQLRHNKALDSSETI